MLDYIDAPHYNCWIYIPLLFIFMCPQETLGRNTVEIPDSDNSSSWIEENVMDVGVGALIFISGILYSLSVLFIVGALTVGTWGISKSLQRLQVLN